MLTHCSQRLAGARTPDGDERPREGRLRLPAAENFERARDRVDEILLVEDEVAFEWARRVTLAEGLIAGPTSGSTLWGAWELAKRPEFAGKNIIGFICDTGERYLSMKSLFKADTVIHEGE